MCTTIRPPPTWSNGHRQRGWVWTRFYFVPPPPPSFGDDASLGIFILFFLDEGRAGRNDLIGVAFKKQCPLRGPQVFFIRDNPN